MKKLIALAFLVASPLYAQTPVSGNVASDTAGSVAAIIKYIGTGSAATVAIDAATGDIELKVATVDDSANVDTGGVCAGGVAASLDVSDAQCDTFGEVADLVNASTHWRMVLVGALRTDTTTNTITTFSIAQATVKKGLSLYFDSAVSNSTSIAMIPENCKTDINCFMTPANKLLENPFASQQTEVRWIEGFATWNTTGNFAVYSVKPSQKASGSESVLALLVQPATTSATNQALTQLTYQGLLGRPHEKVIVRFYGTSTMSAFNLHAYGIQKAIQ